MGFLAGCVGVLGAAPSPTPNREEIEFTQKGLIFKVLLLKLSGVVGNREGHVSF